MERPKKKDESLCDWNDNNDYSEFDFADGYNQACDDWEKYCDWQYKMCQEASMKGMKDTLDSLPSEEEIKEMAWDCIQVFLLKNVSFRNETAREEIENIMYGVDDDIAKAIHKRIRGE